MGNKVFIITPEEIKNDSRIEITTDDKTLKELVQVTQEVKLNSILGDTLYNRVIDSIYNNSVSATPLPTAILSVLPHIKKYLLYQIITDFIYVNHYKLTNKGVFKLNDSNATSASNTDIDWYKSYYSNATAAYKKKLVDYLKSTDIVNEADETDKDFSFSGVYLDVEECGPVKTSVVYNPIGNSYLMNTTQRLGLSPQEGMMVFDTDIHKLFVYDGTIWKSVW